MEIDFCVHLYGEEWHEACGVKQELRRIDYSKSNEHDSTHIHIRYNVCVSDHSNEK